MFPQLGPKMVPFILGPQSKRAQIVSPKMGPGLPQNRVRRQAPKMIPFFCWPENGLEITKVPSDQYLLLQGPFPRASLHSRNSNWHGTFGTIFCWTTHCWTWTSAPPPALCKVYNPTNERSTPRPTVEERQSLFYFVQATTLLSGIRSTVVDNVVEHWNELIVLPTRSSAKQ